MDHEDLLRKIIYEQERTNELLKWILVLLGGIFISLTALSYLLKGTGFLD